MGIPLDVDMVMASMKNSTDSVILARGPPELHGFSATIDSLKEMLGNALKEFDFLLNFWRKKCGINSEIYTVCSYPMGSTYHTERNLCSEISATKQPGTRVDRIGGSLNRNGCRR